MGGSRSAVASLLPSLACAGATTAFSGLHLGSWARRRDRQNRVRTHEHADPRRLRLRECDYGALNGQPATDLHRERRRYLDTPYPGGEKAMTERERFLKATSTRAIQAEVPRRREPEPANQVVASGGKPQNQGADY